MLPPIQTIQNLSYTERAEVVFPLYPKLTEALVYLILMEDES